MVPEFPGFITTKTIVAFVFRETCLDEKFQNNEIIVSRIFENIF